MSVLFKTKENKAKNLSMILNLNDKDKTVLRYKYKINVDEKCPVADSRSLSSYLKVTLEDALL